MNVLCWKASIIVLIGVILALSPALADEVVLKNGDRITGKLVRMEGSKLEFETAYAGKITIDWSQVASLLADEPIKVILSDDTTMLGKILSTEEDTMRLKTEKIEEPTAFSYAEIKAINPPEKPLVRVTARANAGITSERGNTETDSYRFQGEFIARTEKSRYTIGGELSKEKEEDRTTVENWLANANYNYFMTQKWFLYADTLFEHDEFADLDLRSTFGAGVGYQFYESEMLNLSVAAGPSYVNEDFIVAEDNDFGAGQWLIRYDQYFFDKRVQLFHDQTGIISLSNSSKWLLKTRQGLRFPIYKGFTATLQYNYDYDNEPSEDAKEKWDSKFIFLLGWQFQN